MPRSNGEILPGAVPVWEGIPHISLWRARSEELLQVTACKLASYAPRRIEWYIRKMAPTSTLIIPPSQG